LFPFAKRLSTLTLPVSVTTIHSEERLTNLLNIIIEVLAQFSDGIRDTRLCDIISRLNYTGSRLGF